MLGFLYSFIIYPLTQLIEFAFVLSFEIFKDTGAAVLGVSFAVSFLCLPLYIVAEGWSEKERKKQLSMKDDITHIKKSFKGDEQYMLLSTLYRENHYRPLMQLRSSFGLLIQIPFFIAAYHFLSACPMLKGASFLFIKDMGSPDNLFNLGPLPINILPITMTAINLISGVIYSKGHGVREKVQIFLMASIFLVILYGSPAGLVLYWTMNNLFSLVKNIFYKLKKPLLVLYILVAAAVLALDFYAIFIHKGPVHKRALLAVVASLLLFVPLALKVCRALLSGALSPLVEDKSARHTLFLVADISLFLLLGLVLPTFVIKSSVVEFAGIDGFSVSHFIRVTAFQAAGVFLFWAVCVYFLFKARVQAILSTLMCSLLFAGLVDAFVFYGSYPTLSRVLTFASSLDKTKPFLAALNILSIIVIMALPILIFIAGRRWNGWKGWLFQVPKAASTIILFSLLIISIINIAGIRSEEKDLLVQKKSDEGFRAIYHFSKTEPNVVLLMLDRAESAYFPLILDRYPEIKKAFSGFTYFPNCASYNQGTILASPAVYGGYEYTPRAVNKRRNESLKDKHNEALKMLPLLFKNNGYHSTVADLSWANYQWIPDLSIFNGEGVDTYNTELMYRDDWIADNPGCVEAGSTSRSLERNMLWFSLFKVAPLVTRDSIYQDGEWWSSNGASHDVMEFLGFYSALDYMARVTDSDSPGPAYFTIVNDTAHSNVVLLPPDYTPSEGAKSNKSVSNKDLSGLDGFSSIGVNIAILKLTAKWLEKLKTLGCYDNTRFVIVSDHGLGEGDGARVAFSNNDGSTFVEKRGYNGNHNNPLLLFKDFESEGELVTDNDFMTNADTATLLTRNLIPDAKNPFTGNSIEKSCTIVDGEKVAQGVVLTHNWRPGGNGNNTFSVPKGDWVDIKRDIFDYKNWTQEKDNESE